MSKPDVYSGYRPYHLRESLFAWAPGAGSRSELANKFHAPWRIETLPDASALGATAYTTGSTNIAPGDFTVPTRKLGLQILPMEKASVTSSIYGRDYVDMPELVKRARNVSVEALEAAVDSLDTRGDGFITLREVRDALSRAYAQCSLGEPEAPLVASLVAIFEREGVRLKDGSIIVPRDMFVQALPIAADFWAEDLALNRPEMLSKSGSLYKKAQLASSIGPQSPREFDKPAPRRLPPASPMRSTSAMVSTGTTLGSTNSPTRGGGTPTKTSLSRQQQHPNELNVSLGSGLDVSGEGFLVLSPRAERTRELTAGTAGAPVELGQRGLRVGALREAALASERALSGASPPPQASRKPEQFKLGGPSLVTSTMRDFGDFGSNPRELSVHAPGIAGNPITTRELNGGTTRVSQHPPGYTGSVPLYEKGDAAAQGLGAEKRDIFMAKTNIADTFVPRVSGYSGFTPRASEYTSSVVDKPKGVDANSEYDHVSWFFVQT